MEGATVDIQKDLRGNYVKLTEVEQSPIAKYACFHWSHTMICQFSEEYFTEIRESSVNTWKAKYVTELDSKQKAGDLEVSDNAMEWRCIALEEREAVHYS